MKLMILCNPCAGDMDEDDIIAITAAWDPAFQPGEDNVLVCPPWPPMSARWLLTAGKGKCDSCDRTVSIAPSSFWLLERAGRTKEVEAGV